MSAPDCRANDSRGLANQPLSRSDQVTDDPPSIDSTLVALGFTERDGVLVAPADSVTRLVPIGKYFELRISLDGNAVCVVVPRVALKITREGQPWAP